MGIATSTGFVASASGTASSMRTMGNVGVSYLSDNAALQTRSQTVSSASLADGEVREVPKSEKKKGK